MDNPAAGTIVDAEAAAPAVRDAIAALARNATVEMTWHDVGELARCRSFLAPETAVFASHLPSQSWRQTLDTCVAIRRHGFEPVPHIPVRRLAGRMELERLIEDLVREARVTRALVIAGDTPKPEGPYAATLDALSTGVFAANGIRRIFVAGHPEGHPILGENELRRAERDKVAFAVSHELEVAFLTQFFFEAAPFLVWARRLRSQGIGVRLVAGLAGPARVSTLFKYALRCGVGASIRTLGSRPAQISGLFGERDPMPIVRTIAAERAAGNLDNVGIHLFSFGGLERTCAWLRALA